MQACSEPFCYTYCTRPRHLPPAHRPGPGAPQARTARDYQPPEPDCQTTRPQPDRCRPPPQPARSATRPIPARSRRRAAGTQPGRWGPWRAGRGHISLGADTSDVRAGGGRSPTGLRQPEEQHMSWLTTGERQEHVYPVGGHEVPCPTERRSGSAPLSRSHWSGGYRPRVAVGPSGWRVRCKPASRMGRPSLPHSSSLFGIGHDLRDPPGPCVGLCGADDLPQHLLARRWRKCVPVRAPGAPRRAPRRGLEVSAVPSASSRVSPSERWTPPDGADGHRDILP